MPRKKQTKQAVFFESLTASMPHIALYSLGKKSTSKKGVTHYSPRNYVWEVISAIASDILQSIHWCGRKLRKLPILSGLIAILLTMVLAGAAVFAVLTVATIMLYGKDLQNPAILINNKSSGITITDRHDVVLYQTAGAAGRQLLKYEEIPPTMVKATLAAEDPDFFNHTGISWRGIGRALYKDAVHGSTVQGGSTLTQQLIKTTVLKPDRNVLRKAQEVILAGDLEQKYSKQQIMQMYTSSIYYGQQSYGITQAAQNYFGKTPAELSLAQNAMLAGLPLGPSRFDPAADPEAALGRRNFVLDRMRELGYISEQEAKAAKAEPLNLGGKQRDILAPHFVFYVLNQLRQKYGDDVVDSGGITVKTTLDLAKQNQAQSIVQQQVAKLADRNVSNGALISTNPQTGDIMAMVGSVDYYQPAFGSVNVTLSQRQPGSSFKPIVYLAAIAKGWNDGTKIEDKPISLPDGTNTYTPQNYDGKFRGEVTMRRALANSLNIPAIHVLQFVGLQTALDTAHGLGITSLNQPERYGLSLVLGGGEVRMIDMAAVYGTFARGGIKSQPRAILSVRDRYNKDITITQPNPQNRVAPAASVALLTNILSDNGARSEEFGPNSPLLLSQPAAVKTGTTNDFRDNWTAGYTSNIGTVVWVGNNNNQAMQNVDGITGAAPIWHNYMEYALTQPTN